ncbi:MAG: gluconolactonase [Pedosphaera sp.]|nr:gluconolactonase [Pedosphaera sp.]
MSVTASRIDVEARELPADESVGLLEPVAFFDGPMPTGVTVSHDGRIFVCFPKWGDEVEFTVAEILDGRPVPFPDITVNRTVPGDLAAAFVSVQSVVVDAANRLWILDTGSPMFELTQYGGPKLVCVDLKTNLIIKKILLPQDVALPTSYLNDVRFDLRRYSAGMAFITDSSDKGRNAIILVNLWTGESWRRLENHPSTKASSPYGCLPVVEGHPLLDRLPDDTSKPLAMGADGIALSADGSLLFYCPLISRRLYSVPTDLLADRWIDDETVALAVIDHGDKGGASDGLESDAEGNVYATNYEHNAILRRPPNGIWETVAHDSRLLWPDTLCLATDGYLYVTANQLHRMPRFHQGRDLRRKPYILFRVPVGTQPVLLRG